MFLKISLRILYYVIIQGNILQVNLLNNSIVFICNIFMPETQTINVY